MRTGAFFSTCGFSGLTFPFRRDHRYAGWLGTVAAKTAGQDGVVPNEVPSVEESKHRLAVVAGTSTCHLVQVS